MKKLIIIGAGRFGREVYAWARQSRSCGTEWQVAGFLDSRRGLLDGFGVEAPILGAPEAHAPAVDEVFVCALGEPAAKQRYCTMLAARGAAFASVIHPSAVLGEGVTLGRGLVLCPHTTIASNATVGDFVTVNIGSFLAHDVRTGPYCQIHGNVAINGAVVLGTGVTVGSNAAILPDVTVGDFAVVGAGSVVLQAVAAGQTVFGNPAKPLGLPPRPNAPEANAPSAEKKT